MPSKNSIKIYLENSFYHIYNRGVEKRIIFQDHQDYIVFLSLFKRYLILQSNSTNSYKSYKVRPRFRADLFDKMQLIAYCLMPNHFHLMVKQYSKNAISLFMQALLNSYVYYFNKKYERTGTLFQGRYKAILVNTDQYLLHLTRYIHTNPVDLGFTGSDLVEYRYSSYRNFLGQIKSDWIHPEEILQFFKPINENSSQNILSYRNFVEDSLENSREILGPLALD